MYCGPSRAARARASHCWRLGYTGWGPGQLESEIRQNGWLHCEADEGLLFDSDLEAKYQSALARIGVSEAMLSGGHFGNA